MFSDSITQWHSKKQILCQTFSAFKALKNAQLIILEQHVVWSYFQDEHKIKGFEVTCTNGVQLLSGKMCAMYTVFQTLKVV